MRKFFVILAVFLLCAALALYVSKGVILAKLKSFLIEKIETATEKGLRIESIDYFPGRGARFSGVTVYKDRLYREKYLSVSYFDMKFPVVKLLRDKTFSPEIILHNLAVKNTYVNGSFGILVKLGSNFTLSKGVFAGVENISFANLSVKTPVLKIDKIIGAIDISPALVKTTDLHFIINNESYTARFNVKNPTGEISSTLEISSPKFNLGLNLKKEEEVYKISEIKGSFLNSSFAFMGEFEDLKDPLLSLYGNANLDMRDIGRFNLQGNLFNSVYFKGKPRNVSTWELGIKSDAESLKIWNFKLSRFHMETRLMDGILEIPLLTAYPYGGVFIASAEIDTRDNLMLYKANCKLNNISVASFLENTELGNRNLRGTLFSEFAVAGNAKSVSSMNGSGRISVTNANLGPMPLLTPLLGNLYGYLQNVLVDLKKVEITTGSCDFNVGQGKIMTENLVLSGDIIGIHARGYLAFDKTLNFEVENKFIGPEKTSEVAWQSAMQEIIVRVGKLISKAYLTGTLDKPKWKFDYAAGMQDMFKGGFEKAIKGIFQQ